MYLYLYPYLYLRVGRICISQTVWLRERARVACAMLQKCSNSLLLAIYFLFLYYSFSVWFGLGYRLATAIITARGVELDAGGVEAMQRPVRIQNKMMHKARGAACFEDDEN